MRYDELTTRVVQAGLGVLTSPEEGPGGSIPDAGISARADPEPAASGGRPHVPGHVTQSAAPSDPSTTSREMLEDQHVRGGGPARS